MGAVRWALLLAVVSLPMVLVGCHVGPRNFENENDRLRAEVQKLQQEKAELQQKLDLRLGELETLRHQQASGSATQPMPGAEPPTLAKLQFGRYSGGVDNDDNGVDDLIRVYLRPLDQQGRLLPVAGRATVQVVAIPDEGEPHMLAERTYSAKQFNDAWRSGFTGQHYTLEVKLPSNLPENLEQVTVKVSFTQAQTGAHLSEQKPFRIRHR